MASRKRPPLPDVVHVAWFWDPTREKWLGDDSGPDAKAIRNVADGVFPHRHRYATYRLEPKASRRRADR